MVSEVTNADGDSFPLNALLQPYKSAQMAHAILEILITEHLGYRLTFDPHVPASSIDAMHALVGCETWFDPKNRGCSNRVHRWHFMVESWHLAFPSDLNFLQEAYSAEWLISTDLGYRGSSGAYVRV